MGEVMPRTFTFRFWMIRVPVLMGMLAGVLPFWVLGCFVFSEVPSSDTMGTLIICQSILFGALLLYGVGSLVYLNHFTEREFESPKRRKTSTKITTGKSGL